MADTSTTSPFSRCSCSGCQRRLEGCMTMKRCHDLPYSISITWSQLWKPFSAIYSVWDTIALWCLDCTVTGLVRRGCRRSRPQRSARTPTGCRTPPSYAPPRRAPGQETGCRCCPQNDALRNEISRAALVALLEDILVD